MFFLRTTFETVHHHLAFTGTGRTFAGFPLFAMDARFADIRLNSTHHIELTELIMYDETFYYTNDGIVHKFSVDRSDWTTISDNFGSADIPLTQLCTMETDTYLVTMNFKSKETDYNRLLFPLNHELFSDFEALGVSTHLKVVYKPTNQAIVDTVISSTTGLEFGYGVKAKIPTQFLKFT